MADKPETKKRENSFWKLITGEGGVNDQKILEIYSVCIICVHAVMVFAFYYLGVWQLSLYNIIITAYYSYCNSVVSEGKVMRGYLLTFIEIILQMIITTFVIGWDSGFYFYVIAIIPLYYYISIFTNKKSEHIFVPMFWSCVTLLILIATYAASSYFEPIVVLGRLQITGVFIFNVFLSFQLITWMSHFLILGYRSNMGILEDKNILLGEEANVDPLTGLYNRRFMEASLESAYRDAEEGTAHMSLIMGDIDFFKKVNDTYGHECGDEALKLVAEILRGCVREGDTVCRWGGEEFLLLVVGHRGIATGIAERIRARIENSVLEYGGKKIKFTITLGVSSFEKDLSLEELISRADANLYYGKNHGRNQVVSLRSL